MRFLLEELGKALAALGQKTLSVLSVLCSAQLQSFLSYAEKWLVFGCIVVGVIYLFSLDSMAVVSCRFTFVQLVTLLLDLWSCLLGRLHEHSYLLLLFLNLSWQLGWLAGFVESQLQRVDVVQTLQLFIVTRNVAQPSAHVVELEVGAQLVHCLFISHLILILN
jgi:hypothetical protein